jgi:DNA-binding response OmpR family regulator
VPCKQVALVYETSLLLVDSDLHRASILDFFLAARGFDVKVAPSLAEARRSAVVRLPNAVIVVHDDAHIDAAVLVPALRQLVGEHPVLVVVGVASCPDADVEVLRPVHPQEIVEAVRGALRRRVASQPAV